MKSQIVRKQNSGIRVKRTIKISFALILLTLLTTTVLQRDNFQGLFVKKPLLIPIAQEKKVDFLKSFLEHATIKFDSISEKEDYFEVTLTNGMTVLLTKEDDLEGRVSSLQLLLERVKIEGRHIKTIDLRFKKPFFKE